MENLTLLGSAFLWGALSSLALPGGAAAGIHFKPHRRILAVLMAVGAGALLFAVFVELFYPGLNNGQKGAVLLTLAGGAAGWLFFTLVNRRLNKSGALLRSSAGIRRHATRQKKRFARRAVKDLARIDLFHRLPLPLAMKLVPEMELHSYPAGAVLCREGDDGDKLFCIIDGNVTISRNSQQLAELGPGDTFGEMALITRQPRNATAEISTAARIYAIPHGLFQQVLRESPALREETEALVAKRCDALAASGTADGAKLWKKNSLSYLNRMKIRASGKEVDRLAAELIRKKNIALAIWLGILLDSIPASLLIGIHLAEAGQVSAVLLGGILLADLPESLTCASHMYRGGIRYSRVLLLWSSLCLLTGVGAAGGALLRDTIPTALFLLLQGIAGGAMLGSIIEAMIPDAADWNKKTAALGTLAGFAAAAAVRLI